RGRPWTAPAPGGGAAPAEQGTFCRAGTASTAIGQARSANSIRRHCPSEASTPFGENRRNASNRKDGRVCEEPGRKQEGQTAPRLCPRLRNLPPLPGSAFSVSWRKQRSLYQSPST